MKNKILLGLFAMFLLMGAGLVSAAAGDNATITWTTPTNNGFLNKNATGFNFTWSQTVPAECATGGLVTNISVEWAGRDGIYHNFTKSGSIINTSLSVANTTSFGNFTNVTYIFKADQTYSLRATAYNASGLLIDTKIITGVKVNTTTLSTTYPLAPAASTLIINDTYKLNFTVKTANAEEMNGQPYLYIGGNKYTMSYGDTNRTVATYYLETLIPEGAYYWYIGDLNDLDGNSFPTSKRLITFDYPGGKPSMEMIPEVAGEGTDYSTLAILAIIAVMAYFAFGGKK